LVASLWNAPRKLVVNYRHGYHAGNFADVVKHIALVAIIEYLKKKDTGFSVIDTHGGRGSYDLSGEQAAKTGEAKAGIAALRSLVGEGALADYLRLATGKVYPGSPLIAAELLRPQDRLVAIEKHPEEFAALQGALAPFRNAVVENGDGYSRLLKLLPPPSRRGLAVIDPPFEATDEFATLAQTVIAAVRKFATGTYLVWYPVKSEAQANAFAGEVLAAGDVTKALTVDTTVAAAEGKLNRAALLVINPPFGLDSQMRAIAAQIVPRLKAQIRVTWIAGSG
jgi:23S rRNA (adenine2030-N6)-methyltransferase